MADGFIVRKGGVADATPAPTIKFVSKTEDSVTFTITNNSLKARDITYGLNTPPTTTTINLAALATSSNQTISNITEEFVTIFAQAEDSAITEFRVRLQFAIYTAATGGTTLEYNSGGKRFKSHTFTSNGNFVVSTVGDAIDDRNKVDYLIIAGGGGTGTRLHAAGGGAGGYRTTNGTSGGPSPTTETKIAITAATFGVTVGSGGTGASGSGNTNAGASNGGNSSVAFSETITSFGGGFGPTYNTNANSGGSGSGGSAGSTSNGRNGGAGTSGQGFTGGTGEVSQGGGGGGGGGAGQVGGNFRGANINGNGGNGGNGLANTLRDGTSETRGGGGAGGGLDFGTGGTGGGAGTGQNGTANTGGGGAGGDNVVDAGKTGGSGIVIIRYEIAPSV